VTASSPFCHSIDVFLDAFIAISPIFLPHFAPAMMSLHRSIPAIFAVISGSIAAIFPPSPGFLGNFPATSTCSAQYFGPNPVRE
jgi:hypothetical protein